MFMVNIQLRNENMALDFKSIHVLEFTLRKIWYAAALAIFPNIENYGYLFESGLTVRWKMFFWWF